MPQTVFTASPPPFDGVPRRDTTIQAHLDPMAKRFISPYASSSVLSLLPPRDLLPDEPSRLLGTFGTVEPLPPEVCSFCDIDGFRRSEVCIENDHALYASNGFTSRQNVLPGSGAIVPLAHRSSPFELHKEEWEAVHDLLLAAKHVIDERWKPDGYTIGWNVGAAAGQEVLHAHLHVIPRFADEPCVGRGIRWAIKETINLRPNPDAPGRGLA